MSPPSHSLKVTCVIAAVHMSNPRFASTVPVFYRSNLTSVIIYDICIGLYSNKIVT